MTSGIVCISDTHCGAQGRTAHEAMPASGRPPLEVHAQHAHELGARPEGIGDRDAVRVDRGAESSFDLGNHDFAAWRAVAAVDDTHYRNGLLVARTRAPNENMLVPSHKFSSGYGFHCSS